MKHLRCYDMGYHYISKMTSYCVEARIDCRTRNVIYCILCLMGNMIIHTEEALKYLYYCWSNIVDVYIDI